MNRATLAYMAGYFDGEGSIAMLDNGYRGDDKPHNLALRVSIVSRDFASLVCFATSFGGKLIAERRGQKYYWAWRLSGQQAQHALRTMTPLLKGKKTKALASLKLRFNRFGDMSKKERLARYAVRRMDCY